MNDFSYDLELDDQGISQIKTPVINGVLKAILFKMTEASSEFKVMVRFENSEIVLMSEIVGKDVYYPLKVQDRDGFGQFFSQSSSEYSLNDSLIITVQGTPFDVLTCTLRVN